MKAAVCLALALFASIGVADTATARGLNPKPAPQDQNGFSEVELKAKHRRARPHHHVVVQLSHPQSAPHPTNPDGTPGHHTIPYEFPYTRVHRFCMQDDDGQRHRMVLTDAEGNEVLSVIAGEECVTATIQAGKYTATLHHDGSGTPSDLNAVFIQPQVEPVDPSVLASLTGAEPAPGESSAGPISRVADGYDAQCSSSKPDFVCCTHRDTWTLQASNGFYVTADNIWTANCAGPVCLPLLSTQPSNFFDDHPGVTSPGALELFEVFTCSLRGGTGPQFPSGTIFLSAPFGNRTGGFVLSWLRMEGFPGALVPGNGKGPVDVVGPGGDVGFCAQPLHLTHYEDHRISLSATLEEHRWCAGGPLSGAALGYITDNARDFFSPYAYPDEYKESWEDNELQLNVEPQDTAFFKVNRTDFTILIVTGSCRHCNLAGANLAGYNLAGADLTGANLARANLSGVNLTGSAKLQSATLSLAYMPDADLTGADLTGADLNSVDFYQVAKRPSLKGATLYQTQFAIANLIGIDLREAHLEGANFSGAQMLGALLTGITHVADSANGKVSFVKALLAGADFNNSTFDGGNFTNAIFSTKPGTVDLDVRNSPDTKVTQPYGFAVTIRPLSTTSATVCPNTSSGPCTTDAQWVAQDPPKYVGYNDPTKW